MGDQKVELKVVLLGAHDVGKSCLLERYLRGRFKDNISMTVGAAFGSKSVTTPNGNSITMGIWDTAGSERFEAMSRIYYRGAGAAVVCFDLTNAQTWEKVKFWVGELLKHEDKCKIFVVGTKKDLVDAGTHAAGIPHQDVTSYCQSIGAEGFFQTSAKTDSGVNELFDAVAATFSPQAGGGGGGGSLSRGGGGGGGEPVAFPNQASPSRGGDCAC